MLSKFIFVKVFFIRFYVTIIFIAMCFYTNAQSAKIEGKVMSNGKSVENASIKLSNTQNATLTDSVGAYVFSNLQA